MKGLQTPHEKLVQYVKKNLDKGYPIETLKYALLSQGYGRTSVQKALESAQNPQPAVALHSSNQSKDKPHITYTAIDNDNNNDLTPTNDQDIQSIILENKEPSILKKAWDWLWE
jgi:secreted Zn-dependent insulinase-like peptidase